VGSIFGLALLAMFNPSLVAAVTVMLLLPEPKKLMFGYLLGAYLTSMTVGMLIVFSFHDSGGTEAAHNTISPAADLALGVILLIVGLVLRSERGVRLKESRRTRKAAKGKKESMPERMLGKGSAKIAFVVGVILTFPGVSYLAALHRIGELDAATVPTALVIVGFCLIMTTLAVVTHQVFSRGASLKGFGPIATKTLQSSPRLQGRDEDHTVRTMRGRVVSGSVGTAESTVPQPQRRG
jgi:hypothetical protein